MTIPNPELELANEFVKHSDCAIFLTGKAGTGKTTFLHNLKKNTPKSMIVTAPTGVAAINAGGVTLHSFFQMPFGPFVPGSEAYNQSTQRRFNKDKINIIKSLDLLVIDEISMVRADLLDGVDSVLRRYKHRNKPFGGVQLLMIGDLHQLSPVVRPEEWEILRQYYDSYYFFSSNALHQTEWIPIELKHIYRQSDAHFINLLNCVRNNQLDKQTLEKLNSRYIPNFEPADGENFITLSTHNRNANLINESQLGELDAKPYTFSAIIDDDYPEYIYPTAEKLVLKKGSQVMFVRNDSSNKKSYYNGKIGNITFIDKQHIKVKCPDDKNEISVERVVWENIKYTINQVNKEIAEEVIGKFTQFPLRLAWAITIHKSQGLTFERAIIDANAAFAHGQVYVALSRCKTFEGMVLSAPITPRAVKTDGTVAQFVRHSSRNTATLERLKCAKISYQQKLILECFDFQQLRFAFANLIAALHEYRELIQFSAYDSLDALNKQTVEEIVTVSEKFKCQLHSIFSNDETPQENAYLQERVQKASGYFTQKIQQELVKWAFSGNFATDNKEIKHKLNQAFYKLQHIILIKMAAMKSCREVFSPTDYLHAVASAEIEINSTALTKNTTVDFNISELKHPELFQALKKWRADTANKEEVEHYRVLHQKVLFQVAMALPGNLESLMEIKGIGQRTAEKYGEQLIELVLDFAHKNKIDLKKVPAVNQNTLNIEINGKQKDKISTKQVSYELYLEGNDIRQIAALRGLVPSTIENHLAYYVGTGDLQVTEFIENGKVTIIKDKFIEKGDENLKEIKNELGEEFSYGEIRMVKKYLAYVKSSSEE